jgi:hypothetical protein
MLGQLAAARDPDIELNALLTTQAAEHQEAFDTCVAGLVIRYGADRAAIPAAALTVDVSTLTAAGNDMGFDATTALTGRDGSPMLCKALEIRLGLVKAHP